MNGILTGKLSTYENAFQAVDVTSSDMKNAIKDWNELYYLQKKTKEEDPCQQIPYTIVRKLTKAVWSEYEASSKDGFALQVLEALHDAGADAIQEALIGGMCYMKPIPGKDRFSFAVIPRGNYLTFARNAAGMPTDVGMIEQLIKGKHYYTLLERRTVDAQGFLTIRNALYCSYNRDNLGQPVALTAVPEYADLQPEYTFRVPVGSVGLVPVRTPIKNNVDGSRDAVSVYAAAVGLIHNINRNEAQLNAEFELGRKRLIASSDMFKRDKKTGQLMMEDDLFVAVDDDAESVGVTIFSPELREASFLARKQDYLRSVENIIGLKRGLLSEVEAVERTAKEITSSEGEYSLTVVDFQRSWAAAVYEALRVCAVLGQLYRIPGAKEIGEDQVIISFGNGILYDEEATRLRMREDVQAGLLKPERYVGFTYGMPYDTEAQRAKIRKELMPATVEEAE